MISCTISGSPLNIPLLVKNVKWSRYRPGVAQRVGRAIALLFHDRGTRRGWVVSTPRPYFTPGKDPVSTLQEGGWAPGPVWTGGKPLPHRDSIPDRPARSQSLHRMSYPAHISVLVTALIAVECMCYSTDRCATAGRRTERGVYLTTVKGDMPVVVSRSQTYLLRQSHTSSYVFIHGYMFRL